MNTRFTIKNFRVFDEQGCTFNLSSINILTGQNGAGKSSVVKALVLLEHFFTKLRSELKDTGEIHLEKHPLGVTNYSLHLGTFENVLHRGSQDKMIRMAYTIKPANSTREFEIEYAFSSSESDGLHEGWLSQVIVRTTDSNEIVLRMERTDNGIMSLCEANLTPLKQSFMEYAYFWINQWGYGQCEIYDMLGDESGLSESLVSELKAMLNKVRESNTLHISDENLLDFTNFYYNCKSNNEKVFNGGDFELLIEMLRNGYIYSMPIIHFTKGLSKDEICKKMLTILDNEDIRAVVEDFRNSKFECLKDYLIYKEDSWGFLFKTRSLRLQSRHDLESILNKNLYRNIMTPMEYYIPTHKSTKISHLDEAATEQSDEEFAKSVADAQERCRDRRESLDIEFILDVLRRLSCKVDATFAAQFKGFELDGKGHSIYMIFRRYAIQTLIHMIIPDHFLSQFSYIPSESIRVQRQYRVGDSNDVFGAQLYRYFVAKQNYDTNTHNTKYVPGDFVQKWVKEFGIADHIRMEMSEQGSGIMLYLCKTKEDNVGYLLADDGYGMSQLLSFIIQIETAILESRPQLSAPKDGKIHLHKDDSLELIREPWLLCVEEPEVHLHPAFQSKLADMFIDASRFEIGFIIETHSEYMVRRTQSMLGLKEVELDNNPFAVYYLPKDGVPYNMEYQSNGRFATKFGKGFFNEADRLTLELL